MPTGKEPNRPPKRTGHMVTYDVMTKVDVFLSLCFSLLWISECNKYQVKKFNTKISEESCDKYLSKIGILFA
jgi:hypothetical protein